MKYTITAPNILNTTVQLPASKSISNRALVIKALSGGHILPNNLSDCDDTRVLTDALRDNPSTINVHGAGTAMRFLSAYYSVVPGEHVLTGSTRMKHRPIGLLVDALRILGANIDYVEKESYPPIHICGTQLGGGSIEMPGNVSSQFVSALLMIGPVLPNGLEIRLTGEIVSRPYIDLTLCTMRYFGADADWSDIDTLTVKARPYQDRPYTIESDWSAASYWYEIAALMCNVDNKIRLMGLHDGSIQGDSVVKYLFSLLGIKTTYETGEQPSVSITTHRNMLRRLDYDFVNQPDLAQTMVVTCALLNMPFRFTGLKSLRIKETDRIDALEREMRKLGFVLGDRDDNEIYWDGGRCTPHSEPIIETYDDHRMAMAFAPAAIRFPNLSINNPEVVSKSYPSFWEDLGKAGWQIYQSL